MTRPTVDLDAAHARHDHAQQTRSVLALWTAVADIPVLIAEIHRGRFLLAVLRRAYADLRAAAQAAVAADRDGEADPLYYVRDELTAQQEPRNAR